jgi:ribosome-binding factor A
MNRTSGIKRAQKESLMFREISRLFLSITIDEPRLRTIHVNRVGLSSDRSMCTVYFYTADGPQAFQALMPTLILYKPSLRKALSQAIPSRYTPDLIFKFDEQFEKQQRIEQLLEKIKTEEQS